MGRRRTQPEPPGVLEQLGLYGYEGVEWPILAGLVTGDPVLLVGGHGTAKTTLARRLAKALELSFWAYDASKALFEDVLGFTNPAALDAGTLDYIETPISIWGRQFLLVDELSRANPAMQSKWLEVIRGRQVMGKPIDGLKHVFSAMNPPSYLGAYPLDEALAGRFAVVVQVPATDELPEEVQARIVRSVAREDAPLCASALRGGETPTRAAAGESLARLLDEARARVGGIDEELRDNLTGYTQEVAAFCSSHRRRLDGRRMGMVWRNLMAACGLWHAHSGEAPTMEVLDGLLFQVLRGSLPFMATEERDPGDLLYRPAHESAFMHVRGGRTRSLNLGKDPWEAAWRYRGLAAELTPEQHTAAVTWFAELTRAPLVRTRLRTGAALLALGDVAQSPDVPLPPAARHRLLELIRAAAAWRTEVRADWELRDAFESLAGVDGLDVSNRDHVLGLRLVVGAMTVPDRDGFEFEAGPAQALWSEAVSLLTELRLEGDA